MLRMVNASTSASNAAVSAYYQLPVPIAVAGDVLGSVCQTSIGGVPTQVHAPLPMKTDYPALAPTLPGIPKEGLSDYWFPYNWAITFAGDYSEENATCLLRLGMVFKAPSQPLAAHPRDFGLMEDRITFAALEGMDAWLDRVRTWVEVLTHQDLDSLSPSYDVHFAGDGLNRWGGTGWISKELSSTRTRKIVPVQLEQWAAILKKAGQGDEPSLEFLLARDARAAFRRGDRRRAAIDAGTAVELVLNAIYRDNLDAIKEVDRLNLEQRNLNSLQRVFDDNAIKYGVAGAVLSDLTFARNKAAHEGFESPKGELEAVLSTMNTILECHGAGLGVE